MVEAVIPDAKVEEDLLALVAGIRIMSTAVPAIVGQEMITNTTKG